MKQNIKFTISMFIIILFFLLIVAYSQDSHHLDAAWQKIAENQFTEAEKKFQDAITEDENNYRPYLGLSFIMQLKGQNEKAWEWFEKAINRIENPYPYIFSVAMTPKGLILPEVTEDRGLMKLLPGLTKKADETGVLQVGAIELMGKFNEEYGDLNKANQYYQKLNAIEKWTLIGPFENISASGYEKVFIPEKEYDPDHEYIGKSDIPVKWFTVNKIRNDRWIDLTRYFAHPQSIFYGNTFVYSQQKQSAQIRVGTSGSVKVFLNDEEIISCFDENNNDLDTYIAETELQKGWNRLLIKCGYSEISQCNFLVRITNKHGQALKNLQYDIGPKNYSIRPGANLKVIRNFAELFFEEQIEKHPENMENYLLLSDCYLRNDKALEAEQVLQKAAAKMPESVLIKNHLIEAYLRGEKNDEIASTIEKIYTIYPDIPNILDQKFNDFLEKENIEEAEEIAGRFTKLLPESVVSYVMKINIALHKGQMEEALAFLKKAHEKYPSNWEITYLSAYFSMRTTQSFERAIEIYRKFIKKRRVDEAYIQLGDTYLKASDVDNFEKTFKEIIKKDPAVTGIYFTLARVFLQLQNYEKAEQYIRESLKLCPNFSDYWSLLGEIKQGEGNQKEAINSYKTALLFNPTNYDARARLRELEGKRTIFSHFSSVNIDSLIKHSPDADKYPENGAVFLLEDKKRVVYPEGASETMKEVLVKVLNPEGIDDFKEYWLPYNTYSEELIVDKAVVVKSEGTEIKADLNNNHVVFKSLEPDDIIYIKWRIRNYNRGRLSHHFWDEFHLNYFYPVEDIRYSLLVPNDFKFNYKTQYMPDIPIITETGDGKLYQWRLQNQPALEHEYNMPDLDDVGKMLFISSIPSWEYLVEWYQDLAKTKTRGSFEITEKVRELMKDKPEADELEIIELIYNFITENIHYSSVSFRQSGLIPQKARDVLVHKIGDCKDVATLCIAMLNAAGISAHYVLVNTFYEGQNKNILPTIEFNHTIVGVETNQGIVYMDLTARNYPLFTVPDNIRDAFALSIKTGITEPFYLSSANFVPGLTKRKTVIKLQKDNTALISRNSYRSGNAGASFRETYRFKGKSEQLKKITEVLSNEFPNIKVALFEIDNIDQVTPELHYFYEFSVPDYLEEAGNMKLLKLPWSDNIGTRKSISYEQRQFDLQYRADSDTLWEEIIVHLPEGYEPIELQEETKFGCNIADYEVKMNYKNSILTANRKFINKKSIVIPQDYKQFKEFYNQAIRTDARQILLKKIN